MSQILMRDCTDKIITDLMFQRSVISKEIDKAIAEQRASDVVALNQFSEFISCSADEFAAISVTLTNKIVESTRVS